MKKNETDLAEIEDREELAPNEAKKEAPPSARERLIMAALDEVEEVGFARFSLRRVANACGVSTAAPYKHFKNKRELIEAILRHINAEWRRRQDEALNRLAGGSLRERLVEVSLEFIRFMVENPQYRSIMMIRNETFDSEYLQIKADLSARSKELIREYCVESGMSAKVARIKMYVVRSLIYGASLMFANCELTYDDAAMEVVRAAIDREFDLPPIASEHELKPVFNKLRNDASVSK
ncbi:MAG: TetR/AcrR family transcriptional regulator [Thermoguttaceae bacterium]|nr:TetR/AcrR family transcriptional regulator [Thermoguttaceae bacterium]